jgi:dipeptidyl aminopeptidase/acylaminoacyl peptidase
MKKLFLLLAICTGSILFAQNGNELIKVTDMLKIKQLNSVTISPDGSKVAFVVNNIEPDGDTKWEFKYNNQIYIAPVDGSSAPKALTAKEGASQPAWSPDGKQLAFVRVVDTKPQIFLLSFDGGEPHSINQIQIRRFVSQMEPRWKTDPVFSSITLKDLLKDAELNPKKEIPKWPYEKPGFEKNSQLIANNAKPDPDGNMDEIRAYLENNANDKKAKVITKLNFQEESTTSSEISFNHFFIVNAEVGAQPLAVTHGFIVSTARFYTGWKQLVLVVIWMMHNIPTAHLKAKFLWWMPMAGT